MALNPADRYSSALKLAEDIENWMADEPVSTHQESLGQRVRRWMRRHRLLVTGAAASGLVTIVALIGFLAYFTRTNEQLRQANREEGLARSQAQRSEILAIENARMAGKQSELALRTLQSVTLDIQRQLKNIPAAHTVRRRLLDTAIKGLAEVAAKLEQRPSVDQALLVAHRDLGDIYFEVGNESALGGIEAARVQFQRALEIAEQLVQANPTDRSRLHDVARCYDRLGEVALRSGSTALGREQFQKSLDIRQRLSLEAREDAQTHLSVATSLSKLGELSLKGNDVQAALESFHRALELRKRYSSSTDSLEQRELSLIYNHVGFATQRLGDADKALEYFRLGLEIVQPRADQLPDDILAARDLADTLAYLAGAYTALGDHQPAAEYYVKSMDIYSQQALADPHNAIVQRGLLMSVEAMAKHCTRRGQVEEARRYVQRMVEIGQQLVATNPSDSRAKRDLALALTNLADLHVTDAQFDEAIELHERALVIFRQRAASDPDDRRGPSDIAVCLAGLAIP